MRLAARIGQTIATCARIARLVTPVAPLPRPARERGLEREALAWVARLQRARMPAPAAAPERLQLPIAKTPTIALHASTMLSAGGQVPSVLPRRIPASGA